MLIFFTSRRYYFVEKIKIVEKQLCKLNSSYGKVSHALKVTIKVLWRKVYFGCFSCITGISEKFFKIQFVENRWKINSTQSDSISDINPIESESNFQL